MAAHKRTGLVTTLLQSSNSLLEITCRRPLDGYLLHFIHRPGRCSPRTPPQPFSLSGAWNINLEMLTIFLSHIKILTYEILSNLEYDGWNRTINGGRCMVSTPVSSLNILFFFSFYYSHIGLYLLECQLWEDAVSPSQTFSPRASTFSHSQGPCGKKPAWTASEIRVLLCSCLLLFLYCYQGLVYAFTLVLESNPWHLIATLVP